MYVIGIDPHKGSYTAAVLDCDEELLGELRVVAGRRQRDDLLAVAAAYTPRIWAIEDASGWGAGSHASSRRLPLRRPCAASGSSADTERNAMATELLGDVRRLDHQIKALKTRIAGGPRVADHRHRRLRRRANRRRHHHRP
jgi:hypothetical protein